MIKNEPGHGGLSNGIKPYFNQLVYFMSPLSNISRGETIRRAAEYFLTSLEMFKLDVLSNTALNRNENESGKAEKNHKIYANRHPTSNTVTRLNLFGLNLMKY